MKRQLPVVVEHAIAEVKALQALTGTEFEARVRQSDGRVSCQRGCSNCCHHPFLVTVAEGLLLYRWLTAHGRWTPSLRTTIEATRDKTLGLTFNVWLMSNIPCPLLEDRKCVAYDARPVHCRTTFSVGDPAACHPHQLSGDTGLIDNLEEVRTFTEKQQALLKRLSVGGPLMPLAEALLIGEAVAAGRLGIEDSNYQHAKDLYRD